MLDKETLNQLYRYAIAISKDDDLAYDLLHSCMEKYLKATHKDIQNPVAFIKRSIRNEYIDQLRKQKNICEFDTNENNLGLIGLEQGMPTLEALYIQQREAEKLITLLSNEEGELLYLWAVEEYTVSEIAEIQGVPKGTLLSKMHRLKKRIKQTLAEPSEMVSRGSYEVNR